MWLLRDIDSDAVVATFRDGERIRIGNHCQLDVGPLALQLNQDTDDNTPVAVNGRAVELPYGVRTGDAINTGDVNVRIEVDAAATLIRDARRWQLCGVSDGVGDIKIEIGEQRVVIGREDDCDVVLDEGHVSRHHAHLERAPDGLWVTDSGSRNGTFVDGVRIRGARRLQGGETLVFDQTQFELRLIEPPEPVVDPDATLVRPPGDACPLEPAAPPAALPAEPPSPPAAALPSAAAPGSDDDIPTRIAPAVVLPDSDEQGGRVVSGTGGVEDMPIDGAATRMAPAVPMPEAEHPARMAPAVADAPPQLQPDRASRSAPGTVPAGGTEAMADVAPPAGATADAAGPAPQPASAAVSHAATVVDTPAARAIRSAEEPIAATVQMQRPIQPVLIGSAGPMHGHRFVLRPGQFVLGRGQDCDVVLPERSVSSRHASLQIRRDEYTLTNLTSSNGIFVNGERVVSKQLSSGDVISLGRTQLIFAEDASAAERILQGLAPSAPLPNWIYALAAFAATIGLLGAGLWVMRYLDI